MKLIEIPKETFESPQKPSKLFLISFITAIIANCITIFGFASLDLKTKIILSLLIVTIVCFVDIIALYTQYYKYYYQAKYFDLIHSLIESNLDNVSKDIEKLDKESKGIKESVEANNAEIQNLKTKLS